MRGVERYGLFSPFIILNVDSWPLKGVDSATVQRDRHIFERRMLWISSALLPQL